MYFLLLIIIVMVFVGHCVVMVSVVDDYLMCHVQLYIGYCVYVVYRFYRCYISVLFACACDIAC